VIENQPRPDWSPLNRPGCPGVEGRVLMNRDGIAVANLRFSSNATIDRHSARFDIDVLCIDGAGFTSVGDESYPIHAGQTVRWPANVDHCLWTEDGAMETIMVERYGRPDGR
jgi:quercetin dioxygenase-like cupin family protein